MPGKEDILLEEQFTQKRMSAGTFLRLVSYLHPYRRAFYFNLAFTFLATLSQLLGPKFIQIGIDRYLTAFTTAQAAMHGILVVSLAYLANLLLGWFLSATQVKGAIAIGQGAINDLRQAVFEHIQNGFYSVFFSSFVNSLRTNRPIRCLAMNTDAILASTVRAVCCTESLCSTCRSNI